MWEVLQRVPDGQKNAYVVQTLFQAEYDGYLERLIRQAIREEMRDVQCSGTGNAECRTEDIPAQMLDFIPAWMIKRKGGGVALNGKRYLCIVGSVMIREPVFGGCFE